MIAGQQHYNQYPIRRRRVPSHPDRFTCPRPRIPGGEPPRIQRRLDGSNRLDIELTWMAQRPAQVHWVRNVNIGNRQFDDRNPVVQVLGDHTRSV
jgi:hypothetical protein